MQAFSYSNSPWAIREDLAAAFRHTWDKFAHAGTWLDAAQRVAIAQEVRNARSCRLCQTRKSALSPFASAGTPEDPHDGEHGPLSDLQVDVVHRLATDASRLTEAWLQHQLQNDLTQEEYVEILSVVVSTLAIESVHHTLGFEPEPLPDSEPGEPSRHRPANAQAGIAWVPMVGVSEVAEADADMYAGLSRSANVITAMSLVPEAVRLLNEQSSAMYLSFNDVADPSKNGGRALSRPQIELIAGRVSALNDCFY